MIAIGQAAQRLGVSPMALRLYEQRGLIIPERTPSGRRLYSHHEIEIVRCARRMVADGLNLEGVRHLLGEIRCWKVKRCTAADRAACPVTRHPGGPCWSIERTPCRERGEDCRSCAVYRELPGCRTIKARLRGAAGEGAHRPRRPARPAGRPSTRGTTAKEGTR